MAGIPDEIYKRLRATLLACGPFDSNHQLRAIFANASLAPWSNQVPEANNPAERVEAVISFLKDKNRRGTQMNGLILLLQVLQDRNDQQDSCYEQLTRLIEELSSYFQSGLDADRFTELRVETAYFKATRTDIFISYSHRDKRYLQELQNHLAPYRLSTHIEIWDDTRIAPGTEWLAEIEQALQCTKIAVLLVSADFLASEFIMKHEVPPLLIAAKHENVTILPIILRPCSFKETPLTRLQPLNAPSRPLAKMTKAKREAEWSKAAEFIWKMLKQ